MTYQGAVQRGAKFVLTSEKGDIKAIGQSEAVLLFSRQRKEGDMVVTLARYHNLFPYKF